MDVSALDAHCHADLLLKNDPGFPDLYKEFGIGGITLSYNEAIKTGDEYPQYWESLKRLCRSLAEKGVPFFYMAGVHPRAIPEDLAGSSRLPARLADALSRCMDDPFCLGLGELGLDSGGDREERVLRWQLEWASTGLPPEKRIGIHTPRENKAAVTRLTLDLLADYPRLRDRILVDHVNTEVLPRVTEAGYAVDLTLQKGKASVAELIDMLRADPALSQRLILNSDGAKSLSAPFLEFFQGEDLLDEQARGNLMLENASRFFNIVVDTGG